MDAREISTDALAEEARQRSRRSTAFHEAGHVVINLHFGLPVIAVTIAPTDEGTLGACQVPDPMGIDWGGSGPTTAQLRTAARQQILALYAGIHAERLADPNVDPEWGANDENDAWELSRKYGVVPRGCSCLGDDRHVAYMERLRGDARRLVLRHVQPMRVLANALLTSESMRGDEADALLEKHMPRLS